MKTHKKIDLHGFTIIEVVLVLAIAGLIFLVVFVALPALQRSQRDTQRRRDMARVATAITNYQANNGGTLPGGPYKLGSSSNFPRTGSEYLDYAESFANDYLLNNGADSFKDPDGTDYKIRITRDTGGGVWEDRGNGVFLRNVHTSGKINHTIYIVRGAYCYNGEEDYQVIQDNTNGGSFTVSNFFAVLYKLEGSGVYCLDNK